MRDELRSNSHNVRSYVKLLRLVDKLQQDCGRELTEAEVESAASQSNISRSAVEAYENRRKSLDSHMDTVQDSAELSNQDDPSTQASRVEILNLIETAPQLKRQERDVLCMIYARGFSGVELARQLGVTAARVSQVHHALLRKLRRHFMRCRYEC